MTGVVQGAPFVVAVHIVVAHVVTGMRASGWQRFSSPHEAQELFEGEGIFHGLLNFFSNIVPERR